MKYIKVVHACRATHDCTVGTLYPLEYFTKQGDIDPDGFEAICDSYSFYDDVDDLVTTHLEGGNIVLMECD